MDAPRGDKSKTTRYGRKLFTTPQDMGDRTRLPHFPGTRPHGVRPLYLPQEMPLFTCQTASAKPVGQRTEASGIPPPAASVSRNRTIERPNRTVESPYRRVERVKCPVASTFWTLPVQTTHPKPPGTRSMAKSLQSNATNRSRTGKVSHFWNRRDILAVRHPHKSFGCLNCGRDRTLGAFGWWVGPFDLR
jgi:hypothetical protein